MKIDVEITYDVKFRGGGSYIAIDGGGVAQKETFAANDFAKIPEFYWANETGNSPLFDKFAKTLSTELDILNKTKNNLGISDQILDVNTLDHNSVTIQDPLDSDETVYVFCDIYIKILKSRIICLMIYITSLFTY